MSDLVKVELKKFFRTENAGGGVFLGNEEKSFAIFIGPAELNALILAGGGISTPRPLTHNLIDMVLLGFDIEVRSVVISEIVEDAFHAVLTLAQGDHEVQIDCRPSDALVVALLRKKAVFVRREVFEKVEDGEALLSAMREEIRKSHDEDRETPAGDEKPKRSRARKPSRPERKAPSPEGKLGDVRDVPGIDWGSLGDLGK